METTIDIAKREEAILAQAHKDLARWSQGDTLGYGQSAAEEVTFFNNVPAGSRIDGIKAFQDVLVSLKGQIPPHDYEIVNPRLQVYGDTGIYTLLYFARSPDGESIARARGTCVYHLAEESWEMVHTHWSALEDDV